MVKKVNFVLYVVYHNVLKGGKENHEHLISLYISTRLQGPREAETACFACDHIARALNSVTPSRF